MLILSQDKKEIVNFDNITNIFILNNNIKCMLTNEGETYIGVYDTEKRAKEVLQEILKFYKATETFKTISNRISDEVGAIAIKEGFVYEMQEK